MEEIYDIIIVGGGPAGITAAIYGKRAGLKVIVLEKQMVGGQITITDSVKNYPGFNEIGGAELSMALQTQAEHLEIEVGFDTVVEYKLKGDVKEIVTAQGTYKGRTVILSMGASARGLNLPNEQNYVGRGISYCAVCDGAFFKDKFVAVIGGGNSALQDVLYLAKLSKKVYHIHRSAEFKADEQNISAVKALATGGNVEQIVNAQVIDILGNGNVAGLKLRMDSGEEKTIDIDGVFIAIGRQPQTDGVRGIVELNEQGYIKSNSKMQTNIPGVFCAGDIVEKGLRQIVTAVSDGAIAATEAQIFIRNNKAAGL